MVLKAEVLLVVGNPFLVGREEALTQGDQKEVDRGEGRHRVLREGELPLPQPREDLHQAVHAVEDLEVVRLLLVGLLLLVGQKAAPLGVGDLSAALRLQGDLQVDQVGLLVALQAAARLRAVQLQVVLSAAALLRAVLQVEGPAEEAL